jgi:hypothetical protein
MPTMATPIEKITKDHRDAPERNAADPAVARLALTRTVRAP